MNKFLLLLLGLFLSFQTAAAPESNINQANQSLRAAVYFYGFEVQRITGLHEDEIESYGCRYTIDKQSFLRTIRPNTSSAKYQRFDVRGEVVFSPDAIYFIDRDGVVRLSDKEFLLDKKMFESEIRLAGACKEK